MSTALRSLYTVTVCTTIKTKQFLQAAHIQRQWHAELKRKCGSLLHGSCSRGAILRNLRITTVDLLDTCRCLRNDAILRRLGNRLLTNNCRAGHCALHDH